MGTHVYIANAINQDVYVLPAEKTGWMLSDIGFNVASLAIGIGEIKGVVMAKQLPTALNTVRDLYNFLRIVASLGGGMFATASGFTKITSQVISQFKQNSIKVSPQQVVDVLELSSFSNYTSFSGIFANLFDAETFNLLVMSDDGQKVTMASTNPDYSWIVQNDRLVRSVYGTTWQQNPSAGVALFNTGSFVPSGSYQQTSTNIRVMLTCNARTATGSQQSASFDITGLSGVSFTNQNGTLVPDSDTANQNGFIPGGSYAQTCSNISVQLTCQAQKSDGSYQAASLDLTNLRLANVANENGVLVNKAS